MAIDYATRRQFLVGTSALPLAGLSIPVAAQASVAEDLGRYIGFGSKQAGGSGDNECGEWLATELVRAGFAVERQSVSVPCFEPHRCELACGDSRAPVWPQPIVIPTAADGIAAPIVRVDADGHALAPLAGALALVDLPFGR